MGHDNFKSFCRMMHEECKSERRRHNEKEVSFEDYIKANNKMLLKKYAGQIAK
jgi:hypothetical protein